MPRSELVRVLLLLFAFDAARCRTKLASEMPCAGIVGASAMGLTSACSGEQGGNSYTCCGKSGVTEADAVRSDTV